MPDEPKSEGHLTRVDFPRGMDPDAIAAALRDSIKKIVAGRKRQKEESQQSQKKSGG